jgi:YD repeat-containing protein
MEWSNRLLVAVVGVGLAIVGASLAIASEASVHTRSEQLRAHAGVEVSTMRTEFTQTRMLSDGTYETRLSSVALNYRDASGSWRPIDNDLVRAADGSLRNGANSVEVRIPRVANGPVRFAADGRALSFSLATADDDVAAESTGKAARFHNAVAGVDVSYEAIGDALKEMLTLVSAAAPSVYRFDVESDGLTPRLAGSGAVHFVDGDGRRQLGFAAPWMRDANGVVSHAVTYEIERGGASSRIALRVDEAWLRAPERRFPVVVDPTIYRPAEHICEIRSGASANTSYCDSALGSLRAGRNSSGIVHRDLFDLEDLSLVVPDYAQVLSSYLAVYMIGQSPVETSEIDLHHLTRGFAPGATWNSADGRTAWSTAGGDYDAVREARTSTPGVPPDDQLAFDMTELAQRIVGHAEPSGNLLLKAADESRTHLDTFWWPEVMVRWSHRTGLSPSYQFEHRELSDGSALDINLANGNIVLLANDIDLESDDGRFTVGRYFNNKNLGESSGTFGRGSRGDFGSISLERNAQDGSYIFFGPGADDGVFHKQIDGTFAPPPGLDATLTEQIDGTVTIDFNDSTETWTFDEDGRLVQTRQDYGYAIDGTYTRDGLSTLRDSLGHTATFAYDGSGDMRTVTDEQSAVDRYDYDSSHRLITYTSPASAQTRYAYDSSNRLQRITLPDRTALRISYHSGSTSPHYVTPVDASGVDQPATVYDGDFEYTTVQPPWPQLRSVYFYDPYTLETDLIQTGSAAAIATSGAIPDLDGWYTRGDAALTVDVSAAQVPDGIQLTELEVDGVEVDSVGPSPCDQWTCPTRARETLTYDPRSDPEGTYAFQVNTVDGDDERTVTPIWRIAIDRTSPTSSGSSFRDLLDSEVDELAVEWSGATDPPLADATPGHVDHFRYRHNVDGQGWSDWATAADSEMIVPDVIAGDVVAVEVQAVDGAGNVGPTSSTSITATEPPPAAKKTFVIADENAPEEYRWTPPQLPFGQSLRVVDGGARVIAVDGAGQEMSTVATRFAVDSDDADVAVTYDVSGSDVLIDVAHQQTSTAYPVIVDTRVEEWDRLQAQRLLRALFAPDSGQFTIAADSPPWVPNKAERAFCAQSPARVGLCSQFFADARKAEKLTKHLFDTDSGGGRANAFRHAYWISLMIGTAEDRGPENIGLAIEYGVAHESDDQRSRNARIKLGSDMDLHNNSEGYEEFFLDYNDSDERMCVRIKHMIPHAFYGTKPARWPRERLVHIERAFSKLVSGRTCAPA